MHNKSVISKITYLIHKQQIAAIGDKKLPHKTRKYFINDYTTSLNNSQYGPWKSCKTFPTHFINSHWDWANFQEPTLICNMSLVLFFWLTVYIEIKKVSSQYVTKYYALQNKNTI